MVVEGYCDSDWASQKHRHLISRYSFHFGMVSWSLKKQNMIALSSTEAKYITQILSVRFREQRKDLSPFHATTRER